MKVSRQQVKRIGLFAGPVLFMGFLFAPIAEDLPFEAKIVLASTVWMASWWITEAIPIYVTALLPLVLFPSLNVMELGETSSNYADRIVFLFLGGFILAKAVEKANLHKRFALNILKSFGTNPRYIVAAFMLVTGFLSGWMSNTATTMLMLPIAAAVVSQVQDKYDRGKFGLCLMLSIAYSASIGGMSTLIGTPPNAIFASLSRSILDVEVTFSQWIIIGLPISAISLVVAWLYMINLGVNIRKIKSIAEEKDAIMSRLSELGKITRDEIIVAGVFGATAGAWITRGLFWQDIIPMIDDSTVVMISAIVLFLIPSSSSSSVAKNNDLDITKKVQNSRNKGNPNFVQMSKDEAEDKGKESLKESDGKRLMSWDSAVTIPWGVLLLIGGGLALANAYTTTNLDEWMAEKLTFLGGMNYLLIILVLVAVTILTGEIISNTATAALLIPISASLATSLQIDPVLLMVPITIATSFGFVMPVGTPPNAIVFASGYVTIPKMARAGLPLDIISIMMVTGLSALLVPLVWSP